MITMSFINTSDADAALLRAAEAEIRARQTAEDAVWAVAAVLAKDDPENPYLGPEATMAFLREQMARGDVEDAAA